MSQLKIAGLASVALLLAGGCYTTPITTSQATQVSSERIYSKSHVTPQDESGKVIVRRDKGFLGGGCTINVLADGTLITALNQGEMVVIYLSEGTHIIGAAMRGGLCGGEVVETEVVVTQARQLSYRISINRGGMGLYPTAF